MRVLAVLILFCASLHGADTTTAGSPSALMFGFAYPRGLLGPEVTNSALAVGTNGSQRTTNVIPRKSDAQGETNGFRAILYLTTNQVFLTRTNGFGLARFTPCSKVKRGVWFYPAVVFASPGLQSDGKAAVRLDLLVRRPDGSVCNDLEGMVATRESFDLADKRFHLVRDTQSTCLEPDDPVGTYTVEAVLRDTVKKVDLRLQKRFTVEK